MLKRHIVGLVVFQFLLGASAVKASSADSEHIQSLKAAAIESCAKGDIQIGLTSFDSAIELAERAYGKDSGYVSDLCFTAGMAAYKTSRYRQCEDYLNKAIAANPNSQEARVKLAEYYKMKGRLNDAKQLLEKTIAQDPTNLEARELLALTYMKENDQARATAQCSKLDQMIGFVQSGTSYEVAPAQPSRGAESPPLAPYASSVPASFFAGFTRLPPKVVAPALPVQPPVQAKPVVPIETENGGAVEPSRKAQPAKKTETKKKDSPARPEHGKHARRYAPSDEERMTEEGSFNRKATLHSKAVLLHSGKNRAYFESIDGDSGYAHTGKGKHNKIPHGMVPPPPPVPVPMMIPAPLPRPLPPPPQPMPKPAAPGLKAATPRVDPGEEKPTPAPSTKPTTPDDEGDFLLDWGGQKKKKK